MNTDSTGGIVTDPTIKMPTGLDKFLPSKPAVTETPAAETAPVAKEEPLTTKTPQPESTTTPVVKEETQLEATPEKAPESETTPKEETPWWEVAPKESPKEKDAAPKEEPAVAFEKKAKMLDSLMERGDVKYIIEGVLAGKPVEELVKDFQVTDYSKMDTETIAKHYGKLKKWDDEAVEEVIGSLNQMPRYEREEKLELWREKLEKSQADNLSKVTGGFKEQLLKQAQERQQKDQFIEKRFQEDVAAKKQFLEGKDFFGTRFTKEDAEDFERFVTSEFDFIREDETYDVDKMTAFWLGARKLSAIQKANQAAGKSEGVTETLKEIARPNESGAGVTKLPEIKKPISKEQGALEAAKGMFTGKAQVISHQ
jgi:hypothetical protein